MDLWYSLLNPILTLSHTNSGFTFETFFIYFISKHINHYLSFAKTMQKLPNLIISKTLPKPILELLLQFPKKKKKINKPLDHLLFFLVYLFYLKKQRKNYQKFYSCQRPTFFFCLTLQNRHRHK